MMMRATLPLLLVAVAGCAPTGGAKPPGDGVRPTGPELAVRCELDFTSLPTEGEIGTFEARIANASQKYLVLRDLVEPGLGTLMSWQVSRSGTLTYDQRSGNFEYDGTKPAAAPRPAFNVALLCPGEEIVIRPKIRLLHLPRRYLVNYFALDASEVSGSVYFESKVDRRLVYKRLFGTDLDLALVPNVPPRPEPGKPPPQLPPVSSHRTVVFPHAETILEAPRQERLELDVRLDPRMFRLADAARKAGITAEQIGPNYTYWAAADAWVMRGPQGLVMANLKGVQALPEISNPDAFFYILDTLGSGAVTFQIRSPLEVRLDKRGFRLLPKPCGACGAPVRRSGEKPPIQCESCKAWLVIVPSACKRCGEKLDIKGDRLPAKCASCPEPVMPAEDAYKYQLHAGRADLSPLLRLLGEEMLRIDVAPEGGSLRFIIRR